MISVVDRYFSLNRILLLIVGLWPYQNSKLSRLHLFCFFGTIVIFILSQFATFMTSKCTLDHIIKVCSVSFFVIITALKYSSFYLKSDSIKCLMEQLQHIYDDLKDSNEIDIIDEYGNNGKRYATAFAMSIFCSEFFLIGAQLLPDFIILFTNMSRSHKLQISTECFIDKEKYYYILLFYINAAICISLIALIATGTLLLAYFEHACGMFKISSYRIKNTIKIYKRSINRENKNLIYKGLIYSVYIHRKAIMFSEYVISSFEVTMMFLIVFTVLSLSLSIFRILLFKYNTEELPMTCLTTFGCLIYMFLSNFIGQKVTDHYNLLFTTAYEVQWYTTPQYVQRFILFILLRGNKSFGLNVGGLFVSSIQCFATLINASLSYFIVMCSMQQ